MAGTSAATPIPPVAAPPPGQPRAPDGDAKRGEGSGKPATTTFKYACPTCKEHSGGRNLVVCIDGTSNQFAETRNTNVVELYSMLIKNDNQATFYNSGIGTYAQPGWKSFGYYKQVISNKLDLAFALRFEKIILSAYAWLAENYKEGDCIYLFGFSRGAYQVRVLSAMIEIVGLIHKGNDDQIPFAFELYAAAKSTDTPPPEPTATSVETVTVSTLPVTSQDSEVRLKEPHTKEVWFPGCHSDIGGSTEADDQGSKFGPALRWMSFEAVLAGLRLKKNPQNWDEPNATESLTLFWRLVELLPLKRLTPHLCQRRIPGVHQRIHESVIALRGSDPVFRRVFVPSFYSDIPEEFIERDPYTAAGTFVALLKRRLHAKELLDVTSDLPKFRALLSSVPGQRSLNDLKDDVVTPLLGMLRLCGSKLPSSSEASSTAHSTLMSNVVPVAKEIQYTLFCLHYSFDDNWQPLTNVLDVSTSGLFWTFPLPLKLDESPDNELTVFSVSFLRAEQVISVWDDGHVRTWDIRSGKPLAPGPMEEHLDNNEMRCASISADSQIVALGLPGNALAISDVSTDEHHTFTTELPPSHTDVSCVAISGDNRYFASGSEDGTIRIWDAKTGDAVPCPEPGDETKPLVFEGHVHTVSALAFLDIATGDGEHERRIVSGGSDKTIRIWNIETGIQQGNPFIGPAYVLAIAVHVLLATETQAGHQRIASGSKDGYIRVWDAEKHTPLHVLRGHLDWVRSVAFSPFGTHVASASDDRTVRLWDVEAGKQVGEPIHGHTDWVLCVAFSPDGSRIASGGRDGTIRIWDRIPLQTGEVRS